MCNTNTKRFRSQHARYIVSCVHRRERIHPGREGRTSRSNEGCGCNVNCCGVKVAHVVVEQVSTSACSSSGVVVKIPCTVHTHRQSAQGHISCTDRQRAPSSTACHAWNNDTRPLPIPPGVISSVVQSPDIPCTELQPRRMLVTCTASFPFV